MDAPLLFVSAGDPSGDNATSRVIACLKSKIPKLRLSGLGGPRLKAMSQEQLAASSELAVLGFWEVARRYWFFRRLMARCVDEIAGRRPSVVLLVDYPGFNLRLARKIKPLGIPVIYYISPQVWAWGRRRIRLIREYVDRLLVILPFEQEFFNRHGIACDFVGHYLLEDIPLEFIGSDAPETKQIALLPGSRRQEIEQMSPVMLEAARRLNQTHGSRAVIAAVNDFDYGEMLRGFENDSITVSHDDSRRIIYDSELVLTASGTATLETAIIGRPMVVVYRTGRLTYIIARKLVRLENIALVNLVLGERVVPELIQGSASSERMAAELEHYWLDSGYREAAVGKLRQVPRLLGGIGASQRAAELIGGYL
jgi:lipid-A-disaccharide synthase